MRETIKIGNADVDMLSNGASPFIYKRIFKLWQILIMMTS